MIVKPLYVDEIMLNEKISSSGLKIEYIVNNLGISRQAFYKKCKGVTPFRVSEVYVLCDLLNITGDDRSSIFRPQG